MEPSNLSYQFSKPQPTHPEFDRFVQVVAGLRAPEGCPWDQVQTHASIAHNMIEEAYEAVDCIEKRDPEHLREELGDVLLQVVLQAPIAADLGEFTIDDVCADVCDKMVRRHPHVFGPQGTQPDAQAWQRACAMLDPADLPTVEPGQEGAALTWEQIKVAEKRAVQRREAQRREAQRREAQCLTARQGDAQHPASEPEGVQPPIASELDDVPTSIPALQQAHKISGKAVARGFEWESEDAVWDQVYEELSELRQALACESADQQRLELGDVLFSLVNVGRWHGLDAEDSLRQTCAKFRRRWRLMELQAACEGVSLADLDRQKLEELWQLAKRAEHLGE